MNLEQISNQILDYCNSTNNLARALGEGGYPHGTWVSARNQSKGRGRQGRQWSSLDGNLFLSLILRPPKKEIWSWIPLSSAVGVAEILKQKFPSLDIQIKWPNDLFLHDAKVGGILCEGIGTTHDSFVIVGLGLNCVASPQNIDQPTQNLQNTDPKITADLIRIPIIDSILQLNQVLFDQGPKIISKKYSNLALFPSGTLVEWNEGCGLIFGLGDSGELIIKLQDGTLKSVYAEDIKIRKFQL